MMQIRDVAFDVVREIQTGRGSGGALEIKAIAAVIGVS